MGLKNEVVYLLPPDNEIKYSLVEYVHKIVLFQREIMSDDYDNMIIDHESLIRRLQPANNYFSFDPTLEFDKIDIIC